MPPADSCHNHESKGGFFMRRLKQMGCCKKCGKQFLKFRTTHIYCSRKCCPHPAKIVLESELLNRIIKVKQQFFDKIRMTQTCWIWVAYADKKNRARFKVGRKLYIASRVMWMYYNNRLIPNGQLVCHTCDNPLCVNPKHLFIGSCSDNTKDMFLKNRSKVQKLTKENILDIRDRYKNTGIKQKELAHIFNVNQNCISRIINYKRWGYV